MEQVVVNASVSLGFRVEAVRGVRAYAIEFGNEAHVDSLLGVPAMKPDDPAMPMWPAVVWRLGGELGSRRTHSRRLYADASEVCRSGPIRTKAADGNGAPTLLQRLRTSGGCDHEVLAHGMGPGHESKAGSTYEASNPLSWGVGSRSPARC